METADLTTIAERYHRVQARVAQAARRSGRTPEAVRLVVVVKAQPIERIRAVVAAGARDLGENYPEQALPKMQALQDGPPVRWHMIGHLQRRKTRIVVQHFHMLHSLDSVPLAQRLERQLAQAGRVLPTLLEFNVGGEAQKHGWPAHDERAWPALADAIAPVLDLPHLQVQGLMTVPPWRADPEEVRPFFRRLRRLRDFLARRFPRSTWEHLSMGMSHDFEVAIEEGATFVRIGSAILGPRPG
ncbi:MAG: YggS family pyridoxal phosphate-dependent enzyme [Chloroflexi bacterium]|nr:YggS family pyridoxal phosphate-dependent enzyme [Chloroflexota bacterium]